MSDTARRSPLIRASHLVAVVTLVAGLAWSYRLLFPSDEQNIRDELDDLIESANAAASEDAAARLANAARLGRHFTPDVIVELGSPYGRLDGRERVVAFAGRGRGTAWRIEIERVRVSIASADAATVRLTATVTETLPGDQTDVAAREVLLGMRRVNDRWLIAAATVLAAADSRASAD